MTDASAAKRKTNKYLWPLLLALGIVALLFWLFDRSTDEGLAERMDSSPVAQQPNNPGEPNAPSQAISTYVPNGEGGASVITEVDEARRQVGAEGTSDDGIAGAATAPGAGAPAAGSDGRTPVPGSSTQ